MRFRPVIVGRSCKAVHARFPFAHVLLVLAGRGHGVAAARKDGTHALLGARWLTMHVELKVSAPFECGALHCASSAVHRATVHTLGSDSFCGGWLIPCPHALARGAHGCAAAAVPYQLASRDLKPELVCLGRRRIGRIGRLARFVVLNLGSGLGLSCIAVHARIPLAHVLLVLAGRSHGVAAARKDGTHALVGVRWLIMHVELEVSAPFECGALHCASSSVHREILHTLGSDSFCGGWLIPGPQATSHGAAAAVPYQLASLLIAAHAPAPGFVVPVRLTRALTSRPLTIAAGLCLALLHRAALLLRVRVRGLALLHRAGGGGCRDDVHHDHHHDDVARSEHLVEGSAILRGELCHS
eukprot:scaffold17853_cov60-Phaeocystis_antarctica.AAC.5